MTSTISTAELAARYAARRPEVDAWFARYAAELPLPPYCSADLRDAGFKVTPVDLNLFPAGHNHLNARYFAAAADAWREYLHAEHPDVRSICIIPESHTRNTFYLQNITTLVSLLEHAGYSAVVATVDPKFVNPETQLTAADGTEFVLYRGEAADGALTVHGNTPDLILLNNDLSDGVPDALANVTQPVLPPPALGWHARHKSEHLAHYTRLAGEWAEIVEIDPWLVSPLTAVVEGVDFHEPDTLGPMVDAVGAVLEDVRAKYAEHGIDQEPYCYIKDDAGTYGMGVLTVRSADAAARLNRKQRNKMDRGKADAIITRVIVQEGVPTVTEVDGAQAEPVMYAVGGRVVGGFRRFHPKRDPGDSLNARGAQFTDLLSDDHPDLDHDPLMGLYAGVTRIAILAAAHEFPARG